MSEIKIGLFFIFEKRIRTNSKSFSLSIVYLKSIINSKNVMLGEYFDLFLEFKGTPSQGHFL